jgi:Flp pilus assembly protein TadB
VNGILTSNKYFGSRQKDKIMARKSDFKTVETDLDELEEKIRKHRRKIAKRIIIVVAAVVALFLIVWLWMALVRFLRYVNPALIRRCANLLDVVRHNIYHASLLFRSA